MFTINIKGKADEKDLKMAKLELVFYKKGYARVQKVINITGPIKDWDAKSQTFTSAKMEATNTRLIELKLKYRKVAEDWDAEDREWSPVELSHHFEKEKEKARANKPKEVVKSIPVLQFIDQLIEENYNNQRIKNGQIVDSSTNSKSYKFLRSSLIEFTKERYRKAFSTYYFEDITQRFLLDYVIYTQKKAEEKTHKTRKKCKGGLIQKLRKLRAVCNKATERGIYGKKISFECVSDNIKWPKKFESKALNKELIAKFESVDRSEFSRLENFRLDLYLFSYYAGGMANVDVCNLTWDLVDIENREIEYERIKFPVKAKPLLSDKAIAILEKYKGTAYNNYVFPVFTHKHTTTKKKTARVTQLSTLVANVLDKAYEIIHDLKYSCPMDKNKDFTCPKDADPEKNCKCKHSKTLCPKEKEHRFTWYGARGSSITHLVDKGYSPYIVGELSGNSPLTIQRHYYKNTRKEEILADMNRPLVI